MVTTGVTVDDTVTRLEMSNAGRLSLLTLQLNQYSVSALIPPSATVITGDDVLVVTEYVQS